MKRGKKYLEAVKNVDQAALYDPQEACAIVKKLASAKFDETIEAHIRTGCDGRYADQQIRGQVRRLEFLYSLRVLRLTKHLQLALTMLVLRSLFQRSRTITGLTLT